MGSSSQSGTERSDYREFTVQQKVKVVLRVLRGEAAEAVAAELAVSVQRVQRWEKRFVEGGRAALLHREDRFAKANERRKAVIQWASLILLLLLFLWVATRFLSSRGDAG